MRKGVTARFRRNVGELAADLLRLVDLQLQLLTVDAYDFWRRAKIAVFALVIASIGLLAALPVALFAIGGSLTWIFNMSLEEALLTVAAVAVLLFGGVLWWSLKILRRSTEPLLRSHSEFRKNLAWFRSMLNPEEDSETDQSGE